ncbi:MAG: TIGR00282 family metallophosphoesterase [Alphaproteobacteria bacterium]|nr:TIGR00282 family metallophosphoesterase [Alphaproteobacteria bacterium]MCY4317686.1 TIGR00282 family metallophosphoesterase [Alphaproteobacteria bacterium]
MRILFLGDVMGRSGRDAVAKELPELRRRLAVDLAVVNGENMAHGIGMMPDMVEGLFAAGTDVVTSGNHVWDRKEIIPYMERESRLLRPINFPPGTPGRGLAEVALRDGRRAVVVSAMARLFMDPLDDPFAAVLRALKRYPLGGAADAILIDFHGEASSEKMAFGHFFDGEASVVVGTHTHVPTADATVLPKGTAYQTDAGMCGDYDSVIGMAKEEPMHRFVRKMSAGRPEPAAGPATVCGLFVETDDQTGLALSAEPVRVGGRLSQTLPACVI